MKYVQRQEPLMVHWRSPLFKSFSYSKARADCFTVVGLSTKSVASVLIRTGIDSYPIWRNPEVSWSFIIKNWEDNEKIGLTGHSNLTKLML